MDQIAIGQTVFKKDIDVGASLDQADQGGHHVPKGREIHVILVEKGGDHGPVILRAHLPRFGGEGELAAGLLRSQLEQRDPHAHLPGLAGGGKGVHHRGQEFRRHASAVILDGDAQRLVRFRQQYLDQ